MKIVVNTSTFGKLSKEPLKILEDNKIEFSLNPYKRTLKEEEVIELAQGMDGMIAGVEPLNKKVLNSLPGLKVISRCGVGMDNVDCKSAKDLDIAVYNTPSGPTLAVAELTLSVMLNLLRKVNQLDRQVKAGVWKKEMGFLLSGKKVGIIGFGRIGQKVAELLKAFHVETGYYDINKIDHVDAKQFDDIDGLCAWADIVTLHLSAGSNGQPLIGTKQMEFMKQGSWLINMSRGGIVDEQALEENLKNGHLAGAALDVFASEPYEGPLKDLGQVILTPHVGSYAQEARVEMEIQAVNNLLKGLKLK